MFTLTGSVLVPEEVEIEEGTKVGCLEDRGGTWVEVASSAVEGDGSWAPLEVPLEAGHRYLARFEGGYCMDREVELGKPESGETKEVEFEAAYGSTLWFQILDEDDGAIPDVVGIARWATPEGEWRERSYRPREDGYIAVRGLPPGAIATRFLAPGFQQARAGILVVPEVDPVVRIINLSRGGSGVRGRCVAGGEPVADFDLVWHLAQDLSSTKMRPYRDSDGTFEFDGLRPGEVEIAAFAPDGRRSKTVSVRGAAGQWAEAVLELEDAVEVRGRVIDAETEEPVPEVTIRPVFDRLGAEMIEAGSVTFAEADGSFRRRATPGTMLRVEAPGYGAVRPSVPESGESVDLGTLRLTRMRDLEVQLLSEKITDFRGYVASLAMTNGARRHAVGADGFVVLPVPPGQQTLLIEGPDGSVRTYNMDLSEVEDWKREIRLDDGHRVTVEIVEADGRRASTAERRVLVQYLNDEEDICERQFRSLKNPLVLEGLEGAWFSVDVSSFDGPSLGSRRFELSEAPEQQFVLKLGGHGVTLHVVDEEGAPLRGVLVYITKPDGSEGFQFQATDGDGICEVSGIEAPEVLLRLFHSEYGTRVLPLDLRTVADPLEVSLGTGFRISVHLWDDGVPASGVSVTLLDEKYWKRSFSTLSDGEGRVEWTGLDEGLLYVSIDGNEFWRTDLPVQLQEDLDLDLPLFRLGNLRLVARNADGLAIEGITPTLVHEELGEGLTEWRARRLLVEPDGGWLTDAKGELLLTGLPDGSYAWSYLSASGEPAAGRLEVVAGETREVELVLP